MPCRPPVHIVHRLGLRGRRLLGTWLLHRRGVRHDLRREPEPQAGLHRTPAGSQARRRRPAPGAERSGQGTVAEGGGTGTGAPAGGTTVVARLIALNRAQPLIAPTSPPTR